MASPAETEEIEALDSVHVDTLLKAVEKAGQKSASTIRIFEKNDFYYYFHSDAELVSKFIYGSTAAMKTMGKKSPVSFCVMNYSNFESVLKHVLLVRAFRVEIFKFVAGKGGSAPSYQLEARASPGNVSSIEHILYGEGESGRRDSNFLVAIKVSSGNVNGQISLGLAAVDTDLNVVKVTDFQDSEYLNSLEAILVQLGPREVLLAQSESQNVKKVSEMISRNKILVTDQPGKDFNALTETEVKERFSSKSNTAELLKSESLSCGALGAACRFLKLETSSVKLSLEPLNSSTFMRLAGRTMKSLNVFPSPTNPNQPSIFSILNQTRTAGGARLLKQWLKTPLLDPVMINERLNLVEMMVTNTEMRQLLWEDHLKRFPDFQRLSAKFAGGKAKLQDMYKVYVAVSRLEPLVSCLTENVGEEGDNYVTLQDNFIKDLMEANRDFEKFQQMVETTMDLKQVEQNHFMINPDFDENLGELRVQLDAVLEKIKSQEGKACAELGVESGKVLKLEHNPQYGYFFRVTLKEEKSVRGNKNYTILESNKSGVKFRNGKMEQLSDTFSRLNKDYEEHQRSIVSEMVGVSRGYCDSMSHLGSIISRLDVIVSFAMSAVAHQYCRPSLSENPGVIKMTQLRHPIVETQENCDFIPNDVLLDRSSSLHMITGPNMGGKSTYLRSVGCAVLMAQCGSFIPAEEGEISVVDSVMVRIGASDCQVEGLSTFMAEMVETHSILSSASPASLVLIDELGRGTSTYDGFGLAWAVSEHIAGQIKCPTLFTTHYTELTELAATHHNVTNYHVKAIVNEDKLTLLYKLEPGVCDKSFGIDVAKIANFPRSVVDDARRRIAKLEGDGREDSGEERRSVITGFLSALKKELMDVSDEDLVGKFRAIKGQFKNVM